jgi:hypothetical protein
MSKPYYEEPLNPQPAEWREQGVKGDRVTDLGYASPGIDPTVPGTQPRGEPHLRAAQIGGKSGESKEAANQRATGGKSRADSGTP